MTRASIWLVNLSGRLLAAADRAVVLGDIVESGETGPQALIDVLGLVMRKQAALYPSCAENPAVQGGDVERGERSSPKLNSVSAAARCTGG